MAGHKNWNSLRFKGTPADQSASAEEARAGAERSEEAYRASMAEIRRARAHSQRQLATALGVSRAQVSRLENQPDLYLSSLERYLQALGAKLELWVVFEDGTRVELEMAELAGEAEPELALT
jgi:transcriptional regulator with XRE-family HTH domain